MRLGPRQFERDRGGGAVLCAWSLYLAFQAESAACKVPRQPIDDAIDEAIIAMDEFIIANSSLRPTREMLETFKQRVVDQDLNAMRARGLEKVCAGGDLQVFRSISPDQMRTQTKALLATPREPVMNPCLSEADEAFWRHSGRRRNRRGLLREFKAPSIRASACGA